MRRKDREIKDKKNIEEIIKRAIVCRVAFVDDNKPYIVPFNFGYENGVIYLHTALEGKKIDIIKKNPNVCVEFDLDTELVKGREACDWTMKYISVIGFGKAFFVENLEDKAYGLNVLMKHYSNKDNFTFPEKVLNKTAIIKIEIEEFTGKQSI